MGLSRSGLALVLLIGAFLATSAASASASSVDQASSYLIDAAHDGDLTGSPLQLPLSLQWTHRFPGSASYPLIANGRVFVVSGGASGGGYGSQLWALNQATGAVEWSRAVAGTYYWSATAYERQTIFIVNFNGVLSAIDAASGAARWSMQLPGQYAFSSAPTAIGGTVYVDGAGSGGTLYAVRESDGRLTWSAPVENGDSSSPAVSNGNVFVTFAGFQDYGFDAATGAQIWRSSGCCEGGGGATPVAADGLVYSLTAGEIFSASDGASVAPLGARAPPAVAGGVLYEIGGAGLEALAASGRGAPLWSFAGDGTLSGSPIVVGPTVFATSTSGELYAVNASDGTLAWSTSVGGPIDRAPAGATGPTAAISAGNGSLLVPEGDFLVAYQSAGAATGPPAPVTAPSMTGEVRSGVTVAVDAGAWTGQPSSYSYQWQRCASGGSACSDIVGATGETLALTDSDTGASVRVAVTAANDHGAAPPVDSPASAVLPALAVNTTLPTISGTAWVGQTLTADRGAWTGQPTGYTYVWARCLSSYTACAPIDGATRPTYAVSTADLGDALEVTVAAVNAGGTSPGTGAARTAAVTVPAPTNLTPPSVLGSPQNGQTLTAAVGGWAGSPWNYSAEWDRCDANGASCVAVAQGGGLTYVASAADVGAAIRVNVSASNSGGTTTVASPPTSPVLPLAPTNLTPPSVSGQPQVGAALTANAGQWNAAPAYYTAQWERCQTASQVCSDLAGATEGSYQPTSGDAGYDIRVVVAAVNQGGHSAPAFSAPVGPVAAGSTPKPSAPGGAALVRASAPIIGSTDAPLAKTLLSGADRSTPAPPAGSAVLVPVTSMSQLLRHGVSARVDCLTACRIALSVLAPHAGSTRIDLLASATRVGSAAHPAQIAAKLSRSAAARLKRAGRASLTVEVSLAGAGGRVSTLMRHLVVRH